MTRDEAIKLLDILLNPKVAVSEKAGAYRRLRELFMILLPGE